MQVASGLPAWLEFKYGLLAIDDVTLRGTQAGNLSLSFPQPTDEGGREHATVRRYSNAARIELERQIFAVLEKRYKRAS
jgi:hypothetical protein